MVTIKNVNPEHLDVFKEIGNIGAGNATTSLGKMLDKRIGMTVPKASMVPFNDVANILNGPETMVVGVMVSMAGDIKGFILLVMEFNDAMEMSSALTGADVSNATPETLNAMDLSALQEVANILIGSYLSAISTLSGLTIMPSVPDLVIDMAGAVLNVPIVEYGSLGDEVLLLQTEFTDEGQAMNGHFMLVPDLESYYVLMRSLGFDIDG